jgi:hypothetical protein
MLGVMQIGQCTNPVWPYGLPSYPSVPSEYKKTPKLKRPNYSQMWPISVPDILAALARGVIVMTVRVIAEAWEEAAQTGIVAKTMGENAGNHAILALEPANLPGGTCAALFRNSWGADWGSGGFALVTFDYLEQHLLRAHTLG